MSVEAHAGSAPAASPGVLDRPLVVLDDDPTGAQLLAGVRVLLEWDRARIGDALDYGPAVHLLTNSRALAADEARALVADAAAEATAGVPDAVVALRGDSTLRGHLLEEYLGVCDAVAAGASPPLLLVPALPSAGRVTVGGVQLIERDGARLALDRTEYASDGVFAYRSSRLAQWARERSNGFFREEAALEIGLDELRAPSGAERVADALSALARDKRPAVCVPDAETMGDLETIASGLVLALEHKVPVVVRSAPAFVGVLSGTLAGGLVRAPRAEQVLVLCGSYVPSTTNQLERLQMHRPRTLVEAELAALSSSGESEIERLALAATALFDVGPLAVLATPRVRAELSPRDTESIARNLARVVKLVDPPPDVLVAKGGITSAVTLREGVGATEADVVGPLLPGVSLWRATDAGGEPVDFVVVPGNVGDADLLTDLVALLLGEASAAR